MTSPHRIDVVAGIRRPIVRKVALTDVGRERLGRERERLLRARHPGVVELLDGGDDHLDLDWAGQDTLEGRLVPVAQGAGIMALVATTVADLHEMGIIHGRIEPSHVIVGADGRPRVGGMRGPDKGGEPTPADDVAALGRLIDALLAPDRQPGSSPDGRRGRRQEHAALRSLTSLVELATDPDPARRPTARALAAGLAEIAGDTHVAWARPPAPAAPTVPEPTAEATAPQPDPVDDRLARPAVAPAVSAPPPPHPPHRRPVEPSAPMPQPSPPRPGPPGHRPRRWSPSKVLAIAAVLAFAAIAISSHQSGGTSALPDAAFPVTSTTAPARTTAPYEINGNTIVQSGVSFTAGRPGDRVQVADWDCDGTASPAIVRAQTGEVFLFRHWPDPRHPETVSPITVAAGVQDLLGSEPGTACELARIRMRDGSVRSLPGPGR